MSFETYPESIDHQNPTSTDPRNYEDEDDLRHQWLNEWIDILSNEELAEQPTAGVHLLFSKYLGVSEEDGSNYHYQLLSLNSTKQNWMSTVHDFLTDVFYRVRQIGRKPVELKELLDALINTRNNLSLAWGKLERSNIALPIDKYNKIRTIIYLEDAIKLLKDRYEDIESSINLVIPAESPHEETLLRPHSATATENPYELLRSSSESE